MEPMHFTWYTPAPHNGLMSHPSNKDSASALLLICTPSHFLNIQTRKGISWDPLYLDDTFQMPCLGITFFLISQSFCQFLSMRKCVL